MKTANFIIYRSNSSWLDTSLDTGKNRLTHDATKIHGGQSKPPEQRLEMTVLMML